MLKGENWKSTAFFTAFLFPGVIVAVFYMLNTIAWIASSTTAIPFWTLSAVSLMWFGITIPLVFIGSYLGWRQDAVAHPVSVH